MNKRKKDYINIIYFIVLLFLYNTFTSCISIKKIVYFNDLPDSQSAPIIIKNTTRFVDPTIESNDLLTILIQTTDAISGGNNNSTGNSSSNTSAANNTYLVDKNGNIELFLIGFVHVGGLTTSEAREIIKQKAREYFKEPLVLLKISNFEVVFIGQGSKIGPISVPSEKIGIVDAIGLAGGIPFTGKHKNILLIRSEKEGEKKFIRFDITSTKIFQSPYYYLKQRDIIYFEPTRYIIQSSDNLFERNLGILSSIVSILSLYYIVKNTHL